MDWGQVSVGVVVILAAFAQLVFAWAQGQKIANETAAAKLAASTAAGTSQEVKADIQEVKEMTADQTKTIEATHLMVNGAMTAQLKINQIALERVAELTKHPDDVAAAELAGRAYKAHVDKQIEAGMVEKRQREY